MKTKTSNTYLYNIHRTVYFVTVSRSLTSRERNAYLFFKQTVRISFVRTSSSYRLFKSQHDRLTSILLGLTESRPRDFHRQDMPDSVEFVYLSTRESSRFRYKTPNLRICMLVISVTNLVKKKSHYFLDAILHSRLFALFILP